MITILLAGKKLADQPTSAQAITLARNLRKAFEHLVWHGQLVEMPEIRVGTMRNPTGRSDER